ncbi:LysM peptidoglycan-binding domain-containing protein [Streptomyces sp. NPDC093089]|uniref:LysM peptidoglycan-binding domain-containing protein n=1 Tax=Streptomyces sp. NPDC093089 TaxID=3366024 RepID=UPI00381ADC3D
MEAPKRTATEPTTRSEKRQAPKKATATKKVTSAKKATARKTITTPAGTTVQKGDGEYRVEAGDTLGTIAQEHGVQGGWEKLYDLNKDVVADADLIYVGQQLHLK